MVKFCVLMVLLCFLTTANGQTDGVELIASPRQDSIMLRWAPRNPYTWQLANKYGYLVKRYTIVRGKKVVKEVTVVDLTNTPIKPAPLNEWEPYSDDKFVSIAAECIFSTVYGEVPTGINPHFAYKKYKEQEHRFGFALYAADQSPQVAKLSGLYFADKTALVKEKYLYKVFVNAPDTLAVDTASVFTGISDYAPLPKPLDLHAEWGDKEVQLSWNILYLSHHYNAYFLEKSFDNGKTYKRISENNAVQVADKDVTPEYQYLTDTLKDNKETIYYRVRGITPFGETSPPSDSVFGKGQLPLSSAPVFFKEDVLENKYIKLEWMYPQEMNEYISGFKIYRSSKPKSKKELVYNGLIPAAREYIDSVPGITNYYLISVYNQKEENVTPFITFVQRIDSFPPEPPLGFVGEIDSLGAAHFHWKANTEEDIDGYRIYRANNPKFEFALIHSAVIKDTTFIDSVSLKVLNKIIYYCIKAVDVRDNQSKFSPILTLKRPDIIPPVPPVIKNLAFDSKNYVELLWVNSSSIDVVNHQIFRKELNDSVFENIATVGKGDSIRSTFVDKTVKPGVKYVYYLSAKDDSDLVSAPSNSGYINTPSDKEEIIKLKRRVLTDRVKLTWNIEMQKEVKKVIVYRSINNGGMQLLGYSETNEYIDNKLAPEKTYEYCIKAIFIDGSNSVLSKPVTAKM
jgi:hypothetical protein